MNTVNKPTSLLYNLLFAIVLLWLYPETLPKKGGGGDLWHSTIEETQSNWQLFLWQTLELWLGFPGGSDGEESTCNVRDLGWEDPLEEGMATPSSILAWRIPWTEEPGELPAMGSQRVRQDWVTKRTQGFDELYLVFPILTWRALFPQLFCVFHFRIFTLD